MAERDALLTQNEVLGAEVEVAQAQANLAAMRAAYRLLTNGGEAEGVLELSSALPKLDQHPALRAGRAERLCLHLRPAADVEAAGQRDGETRTRR